MKGNHSGKATRRENAKREIIKDGFLSTRKHVRLGHRAHSIAHLTVTHGEKHLQEDRSDPRETITSPGLTGHAASPPYPSPGFDEQIRHGK